MISLIRFLFIILSWDAPVTGPTPDGYEVAWKPCNQATYYFDVPGTYCRLPGVFPFTDYKVRSYRIMLDGTRKYSEWSKPLRWFHPWVTKHFNYNWGRK